MRKGKVRTVRGVTYFPTYTEAREYAKSNGFPWDRINSFGAGWAIQLRISGPYVNINEVV